MLKDDGVQDILRANLRLLLKHDPVYNATSLSKEIAHRGKDYINDFLKKKDGLFKKSSIGMDELLKISERYGLYVAELTAKVLDEGTVKDLMSTVDINPNKLNIESFKVRQARSGHNENRSKPLVSSFDPDEPDDAVGIGESKIRIVGNTDEAPAERPDDAICELVSVAGLGNGQEVQTDWARDGNGLKEVDALRSDYWRFPKGFLQREIRRSPADLIVVECDGDSMEPTLISGCRVVVDTTHKKPSPDGIYAILDRFKAIRIKRLQMALSGSARVRVLSDNPAHHAEEIDLADLTIVGRVVGAIRTF